VARVTRQTQGIESLTQKLKEMGDRKLEAGWFESAKYGDGTPVAGIMAQNEYGNPARSIPARPFMRPAAEKNRTKWKETAKKDFAAVVQGKKTVDQVLDAMGLQVEGDIKNAINSGNHAALSPITIALRKHRNEGAKIGGAFVGAVAAAIAEGKTGRGELGDQSFGNITPLQDSGYAFSTVTYEVT
jgi:hypothetical protein